MNATAFALSVLVATQGNHVVVTPLAHAERRGYREIARLIRAAGGR